MTDSERQTELYTAFLKSIETIGVVQLKKSSIFIRNVDDNQVDEAKAA